jgi:hypothetical protein
MMAQAAGDLGAVVSRWKCNESLGKWRETGSDLGRASQVPEQAAAERREISRGGDNGFGCPRSVISATTIHWRALS